MPEINALEPEVERLTDDQLRGPHRRLPRAGRSGPGSRARTPSTARSSSPTCSHDLLPDAFATVREAGRRVLGQRHFDVQLMGGAALHLGWVAEMKTGEGKTLVATLPSYLNALAGRGVHLITVNDYLATPRRRLDGPAAPLPRAHGRQDRPRRLHARGEARDVRLRHHVRHQQRVRFRLPPRQHGHEHRRPGAARRTRNQSLSPHYFAIVDEVDSILIDEARTPLIISGRATDAAELYYQFARIVRGSAARARLRGRRGQAHRRAHRGGHRAGSRRRSASRTSTSTSTRTTCTRSSRRCAPRSCSSATSTTSSRTARCTSSTSSPAASSRAAAGAKVCTRRSRPRKACTSRKRTRRSRRSRSRTTSACTTSSRA